MTLGINGSPYAASEAPQPTAELANPYALTPEEQAQWDAWEALRDDDKGEYLHQVKQDLTSHDTFASKDYWDSINGDVCVQRLAGGGAVVGGAIRPDALVTIGGIEMTVQQAVDSGIRPASMIGHQTGQD
ncbi:hypothetical protein [Marinobacter sp. X15-166B]|uniref:hypothetical protein n=1 Tax=Marinobacter sp. X15-166B TaxID=1897620 RepID=UPI00085BD362|nr:hypothetical protein [Marinobacter sp. X15-166B]OEY65041.1 hypothetical protein BG841_00185 [Marinobacter sp. X15-166B]